MIRAPRWLTPRNLEVVLDELAASTELIAPVHLAGEVVFQRVAGARQVCRDYVNALAPPKEYFLPTPERLLRYRLEAGVPRIEPDDGGGGRELALFGIRSCDVAGLAYLATFLSGGIFERAELADTPFLERRDRATLLSVVCQKPGDTCMCVCCQGGPALTEGYDWQLTELAAGWLVEIGSDRGEELAERFAGRLEGAPAGAAREKDERVREVVRNFERYSTNRVQTMAAARMLSSGRLSARFWSELGERCFECGGCAFVCPTCYCFNVVDLGPPGAGQPHEHAAGAVPAVPGGPTAEPPDGGWSGCACATAACWPDTCGRRAAATRAGAAASAARRASSTSSRGSSTSAWACSAAPVAGVARSSARAASASIA